MLSIERRTLQPQPVLFVRLSATFQNLAMKIGEGLGKSVSHAKFAGHAIAGRPYVRYTSMGPDQMTIEAGTPLASAALGSGEIEAGELPGGSVVVAVHGGPYDQLRDTYAAIQRWMGEHGVKPAGAPWESYVTEPADHPDTSTWRTEIYWPVSQ
jgi:AraC family transcriptional regulator